MARLTHGFGRAFGRGLARGLGIAGAAVLLAIPFIASAQQDEAPDDPALVTDAEVDTVDGSDTGTAADVGDDVERVGPSWWTGGPYHAQGRPPWAGGPGGSGDDRGKGDKGPPPWAGAGGEDRPDGSGPPWFDGEREKPGKPPWAGGPRRAELGGTPDGGRRGNGRPPWAGADD